MRRSFAYAAQHLTSIEVNGTFYRTQSPASYRKWAAEVPDGFVFSLKGPRFAVNRRVLAEAGDSIKRFLHSGISNSATGSARCCGNSRRPRNTTRPISANSSSCCPPRSTAGRSAMWSKCAMTVSARQPSSSWSGNSASRSCIAEHATYPAIADITGDFVYARLQKGEEKLKTGYAPKALDDWAARAKTGPKAARRPT